MLDFIYRLFNRYYKESYTFRVSEKAEIKADFGTYKEAEAFIEGTGDPNAYAIHRVYLGHIPKGRPDDWA
jgi:hypothetical protein